MFQTNQNLVCLNMSKKIYTMIDSCHVLNKQLFKKKKKKREKANKKKFQ